MSLLKVDEIQKLDGSDYLVSNSAQAYEFDTVASYKAFTAAFPVGKVIHLLDRGASFSVIAGTGTADDKGIIASATVAQSIDIIIDTPHVYPEWYGAIGDGVEGSSVGTDNGDILLYALATRKRVVLDPDKIYGTTKEIAIRSQERLHGGTRSYLDVNAASSILWIGALTPVVAVVYMANNDDRMVQNTASVAYAECVDILIDGNNIADVGWYSNYTSSGTRINNVYAKNTLKCAILVTLCFYTELDYLTGRGNQGSGVAIGQYDSTGLMYSGGDASVNGLGNVNIEGHSNGQDLTWNPDTNSATGFGLGLFGTIHKTKFIVTLEANHGSALHENVINGEFDVYGYIESSAKIISPENPTTGEHSVHLLGSPSIADKCTLDLLLRSNQRVNFRNSSNIKKYFVKLDGGDNGVGLIDNGYEAYALDPRSRFNYFDDASNVTAHEKVLSSGTFDLNGSGAFTVDFYLRARDRGTPILRIVQKAATLDLLNFNVRIDVDGATITTKGVNVDNKAAYDVTEITTTLNNGHFLLQGTQSVGTNTPAYYEVILRELINYEIKH